MEFWVAPSSLFHPCPDPEITDTVCNLQAFVNNDSDRNHIDWFNHKEKESYSPLRYPWTQPGYTYYWGNLESDFGLSEFVIQNGAHVEVNKWRRLKSTYNN